MFSCLQAISTRLFSLGLAIGLNLFAAEFLFASSAAPLDLFLYMQQNIQAPIDPAASGVAAYNRMRHFGGWVKQNPVKNCRDTREMVLERSEDPAVAVEFNGSGCSILSGLWHEPYTGADVEEASQLQIDHVVPLQVAYYSGAAYWSAPTRCKALSVRRVGILSMRQSLRRKGKRLQSRLPLAPDFIST